MKTGYRKEITPVPGTDSTSRFWLVSVTGIPPFRGFRYSDNRTATSNYSKKEVTGISDTRQPAPPDFSLAIQFTALVPSTALMVPF